jgi:hypothetical protein
MNDVMSSEKLKANEDLNRESPDQVLTKTIIVVSDN